MSSLRIDSILGVCESLLRLCASLTLAVFTISGIAALLAIATWYESHYGAAAAKLVVYESAFFYAVLFLLALNVAAAVIVRYPWRRKHTGFIVTHIGIEVLLLGCLIDIRSSAEGRVALRPGQSVDVIDSIRDGLFVSWDSGGRSRTEVVAMDRWLDAGFPSLGRFLASPALGLPRPGWPANQVKTVPVAAGVSVELLDWAPAAKTRARLEPAPGGTPAAELRLSGRTPAGGNVDERLVLHNPDESGANGALFNGIIEASLRRSASDAEARQFVEPIDVATLGTAGVVRLLVDGRWHALDVAGQVGKTSAIGESNLTMLVEGYYPAARWDGHALSSSGDVASDPMVKLVLRRGGLPALPLEVVVSARFPALTGPLSTPPANFGALPTIVYDHPAVLRTDPKGVRGRLELLQTTDGRLLYRRCGLRGVEASGEIKVGEPLVAWMGLSLELTQHEPAGAVTPGFAAADVASKDLSDSMRAARVALVVDGERHAFSVARGGGAKTLATKRGAFTVHYGFESIDLPASITLKAARMSRDPGTDRAATYESDLEVLDRDGNTASTTITMNEPLTVGGRTFYQAGFDENLGGAAGAGGPISVLSMRYDPGRPVKYAGCALIVAGIFLLFYMRGYFARPAARAVTARDDAALPAGVASPQLNPQLNLGRDA